MKRMLYAMTACIALLYMINVAVYSSAEAQGQGPGARPRGGPGGDPAKRAGGKITAIGGSSITVEKRDGAQETITVTGETKYFRNREEASLSDFKVGDFAMAQGSRNEGGQFTAERVMGGDTPPQGPPDGAPRRGPGRGDFNGVGGEAQSIDASARTITVKGREGESQVIYTTDSTVFNRNREQASLQDFKAGDHVMAHGSRDANGKFTAERVFGGDQRPPRPPR